MGNKYRKKARERLSKAEHSKKDQIPGKQKKNSSQGLKSWGRVTDPEKGPTPFQASQERLGPDQDAQEVTGRSSHLSMLLKVYWVPCLVSISKSKERVVVVPRAKLTKEISSKRMCTGGLWT